MPLFWMLLGAGITLLVIYGGRLFRLPLKWFDWLWLVGVVLLAVVTLSFVIVSVEEGESRAALRGALLFGLPTLLLALPMIRRWGKLA